MSASVMEAIETSVVARLLTVTGVEAAKAVPCGQVFRAGKNRSGEDILLPQTTPGAYPGCVVSLAEEDVHELETVQNPTNAFMQLAGTVYIAVYAKSPSGGVTPNDARYKAWEVGEAIQKATMLAIPSGMPAGSTPWNLKFAKMWEIPVDASTHGLMIACEVRWGIGTST